MDTTFSIRAALSHGWMLFKHSWRDLVLLGLLIGFINIGLQLLNMIPFIGWLIGTVLGILVGIGTVVILLDIYDKREVELKKLFTQVKYFWRWVGLGIISMLIVMGGYVLLIVPGIIAGIALMFPKFLLVDKDMGVMESIRTSWAITKGKRLKLFLFILVVAGLNLLGLIALFFGLLITAPVTFLATLYVYKTLLKQAEDNKLIPVEKLQKAPLIFMIIGILAIGLMLIGVFSMGMMGAINKSEMMLGTDIDDSSMGIPVGLMQNTDSDEQ